MSNLPEVLNPADVPAPKRKRKSVAERREALMAQLRRLEAKAEKERVDEAIDSGECYDPEGAKKLRSHMHAIRVGSTNYVKAGLVSQDAIDSYLESKSEEMTALIDGPS